MHYHFSDAPYWDELIDWWVQPCFVIIWDMVVSGNIGIVKVSSSSLEVFCYSDCLYRYMI